MSVGADERRQWLRISEFDTGDLDFTVPEPALAGMWEGCVDTCVKLVESDQAVAVNIDNN